MIFFSSFFYRLAFFFSFLHLSLSVFSQDCGCTYTIPFNSHVDGNLLNIQPGDVICFRSDVVYGNIKFSNINGTASSPVIIKNCGGKAIINSTGAFGVKFENSKHFKVLGNGDANHQYGIKITTISGFYLTLEGFSTNFEVAHVEIAGSMPGDLSLPSAGFAGIGVKTKPYCDGSSNRGVWTLYSPVIHDNYIHDVGGEGMYIGHGFYKGRVETGCTDTTYSHSVVGLRLYNNLIERTGYDGMQVKNTDSDCEIYDNVIRDFGKNNEGAHNEGLFMGEGVTGKAFNNWIENGTGHGIQFQGLGNNDIYNNVVINVGGNGMYTAHGPYVIRTPGAYFNIFNNTFINSGGDGFVFFNEDGGPKRVFNNIFANVGLAFIKNGAPLEQSNNYFTNDIGLLNFVDVLNFDFHLQVGSPAIDSGANLSSYGLTYDYDYLARPFGDAFDIGAFEFGGIINQIPSVSLTSPTLDATFIAGTDILIQANASDADGSVYKVEFFNGTVKIGESLSAPYAFTWSAVPAGSYNLIARATDDLGAVASSSVVLITVTNDLPFVNIIDPVNGTSFSSGSDIVISALATDIDGTIAKVEFLNGTILLGEDLTLPYSFTWMNVPTGTYNLTARAIDNAGGVSVSTIVNISIVNISPTINIISPASESSFPAGSIVTIGVNASDSDGTISKVEFFYGTTKIGEDLTGPYSINSAGLPVGVHSITARAIDNGGAITVSSPIRITITNILPVVNISSPADGASLPAGSDITINAIATDADGAVSKVEFFYGTIKIGEDLSSPYSIVWSNMPAGTYSLIARATDNSGAVGTSSPVSVTLINAPPTVSITAPVDNTVFSSGALVAIMATANDVDGSITKVEFYLGALKIGEDDTAPYSFDWVASVGSGTYTIQARATDNAGAVASSSPIRVRIVNSLPVISITSPANMSSFLVNSDIAIEVSASDADGTISKVEFYNGSTKLGEDLTMPYSFVWNSVQEGTYSITASATDNVGGIRVSSPVTIIVNDITNMPPLVSIISPADNSFFNAGDDIIFSASASDPDGTIIKVEFFQGSTKMGEAITEPYTFTWTNVPLGNYSITVSATDDFGETTTSEPINIAVDNLPPLISITSPLDNEIFSAGTDVAISVNPTDPDGSVVKVEFYEGNSKLGESISNPFNFTWSNFSVGAYSITAVATDNSGAVVFSEPINITITNNSPIITITEPANNSTVAAGTPVIIIANATDSDGTIAKVEFFQGNVKLGESFSAPYTFSTGNLSSGSYSFIAVATDNAGASTISSPVSITVVNNSPSVSIIEPADNALFSAGSSIRITALATDTDGSITKVEFYEGGIKIGESLTSPYTFTWMNVAPGGYSISAVVTDNAGAVTTSQPANITVTNYLPSVVITSPVAGTVLDEGTPVSITVNASDQDGSIIKVEYFQGSVKLGEVLTQPFDYTWTNAIPGMYFLTAVATDDHGGTDTSLAISIQIREPNQLPLIEITFPDPNTQFSECSSIEINVNAHDNDGAIVKVEYFLDDEKMGESISPPHSFSMGFLAEGTYFIYAKAIDDRGDEASSASIRTIMNPSPQSSFTAAGKDMVSSSDNQPLYVFVGDTVAFTNTTDTNSYSISMIWSFKDNTISNEINPFHVFNTAGTYNTELSVYDNSGCSDIANVVVVVVDTVFIEVFVPKAFSPNERIPENQVCKVYGKISNQDFVFQVFSRWGQIVYQTTDFLEANARGWNGGGAPMGTYTYVVKGKYLNGEVFEKAGTVTLLR